MSWRILHGVRGHVTWYMKDDIDRHPNWLAWYTCCTILAYMAVIFNERDLTFCFFPLIWCRLQRSLEFSVLSVFSTDRPLYSWPHIPCGITDICTGYQQKVKLLLHLTCNLFLSELCYINLTRHRLHHSFPRWSVLSSVFSRLFSCHHWKKLKNFCWLS